MNRKNAPTRATKAGDIRKRVSSKSREATGKLSQLSLKLSPPPADSD